MAQATERAEQARLDDDAARKAHWKRWGPYLSARQWGTVREDYSADGNAWAYFPHDHARSRAYRWGEDGLLGLCDHRGRLCFAFAFWNGKDPYLKERLFGLANAEGNHGEDVKEAYWFLDGVPSHAWLEAVYRYPLAPFPYDALVSGNKARTRLEPELELADTGVLDGGRYVDAHIAYAKAGVDDLLIRLTLRNHASEPATLDALGTLWFRNTWSWGGEGEEAGPRPSIRREGGGFVTSPHLGLGSYRLEVEGGAGGQPELLLTHNETNAARLFGAQGGTALVKDAFHTHVVSGPVREVLEASEGTKAAARWRVTIPAGGEVVLRLRLASVEAAPKGPVFGAGFERVLSQRKAEADAFYGGRLPAGCSAEQGRVARQAYAGLIWSQQFYGYAVRPWLAGDPAYPPPPPERLRGRNAEWQHLYNRDVILMPDTWEYPWYAAWDLGFHAVAVAPIDSHLARQQLLLLLREWYMHPNGQMPAYEWNLGDVNPPVHAWACWRAYQASGPEGKRDRAFLARAFQKLLLNFTWWVNRKDAEGRNLFAGGFLGLDNVGVFDRSMRLPDGTELEQADGTAWMAFFAATMLGMALELAREDPAYEDMATKFFEHFLAIAEAMNGQGGTGLWDEEDGFYYDQVAVHGRRVPMRVRSMVGVVPLFAAVTITSHGLEGLEDFRRRSEWFVRYGHGALQGMSYVRGSAQKEGRALLAIAGRERLERVLRRVLDEREFLSPYGIRSLSRHHKDRPFGCDFEGRHHQVAYEPAEGQSGMFGGNSNWRGPIWLPMNYLLIEALERYHRYFGDEFQIEMPTGSGRRMNLAQVAAELAQRVVSLFLPDASGRRPCLAPAPGGVAGPPVGDRVLFHEYFDGDTGRGLGASHQTGWTALVARLLERCAAG